MTAEGHGATTTNNRVYGEAHNSTGHYTLHKRDDPFHTDYWQRDEMVYISQPRNTRGGGGVPIDQLGGQYRYYPSSGDGARVYMIDSVSYHLYDPMSMLRILGCSGR